MATLIAYLEKAKSYIGWEENPPNSNINPFAPIVGHANGYPYCASYVEAVAKEVGLVLPTKSAYTPRVADDFKLARQWFTDNGRPGDLALFDFPDKQRGIQHIGIVESVLPGFVITIEANTSSGLAGSQDNGGGVYRRTRPRFYVVGFGRPNFDSPVLEVSFTVQPQYNPPLPRFVSWLNCQTGGGWGLGADGGIFALGGAPFLGTPAGKDYFIGHTAANIKATDDPEAVADRKKTQPTYTARFDATHQYMIQATDGAWYGPDW